MRNHKLYIRNMKTAFLKAQMDKGCSVFRYRKPRALARGASFFVFIIVTCVVFLRADYVFAAKKKIVVQKPSAAEKKNALKQAEEKLNNTVWKIKLVKIPAEIRNVSAEDTLSFADGKVQSKQLSLEGFLATNYSLYLKGENINVVIWETMQTDAKGNIALWKGEIENERMSGVISRQPKDKPGEDYTFVSIYFNNK